MKAMTSTVAGFLTICSLMMGISTNAQASDFAVALGMRSNSAEAVPTGLSSTSMTGLGGGVIGFFDLAPSVQGRVGFLYNQRNTKIGISGSEYELTANYLDIPVTAMYKFADYAGAFAGPVIGLAAGKTCTASGGLSCAGIKDPESSILGLQFGASFKFAPQVGAEVYYEMVSSEYWKDLAKNMKTVGLNVLITFE